MGAFLRSTEDEEAFREVDGLAAELCGWVGYKGGGATRRMDREGTDC